MADIKDSRQVSLPYEIARGLIESKIRDLNQKVDQILTKWNQVDIDAFQKGVREGKISEAETDAIIAGNLVERLYELKKIFQNL